MIVADLSRGPLALKIVPLMVGERKGREDRRKRRIRMVVMGETQRGGCLLSLKDDGQRERGRGKERGRDGQTEVRMLFIYRRDFRGLMLMVMIG